jgi:hypothetical protein
MSQNLTNQYIVDTYDGLLHSESSLPSTGTTPMYDGLGNRSDISIGRINQGVVVHSTLSATNATIPTLGATNATISNATITTLGATNATIPTLGATNATITTLSATNLKVGQLNLPSSATTTGNVMVASSPNNLAMQPFSTALPDTGVTADVYEIGNLKQITVDAKGRVTSMFEIPSPNVKKDMGRTRVVVSPSVFEHTDVTLTTDWQLFTFDVDNTVYGSGSTYKAATFYIEKKDATPLASRAKIRSSLRPTDSGGMTPLEFDEHGHLCVVFDAGAVDVGAQFFSSVTHVSQDSLQVWLKDNNADNNAATWDISLQAVHY